MPHPEHPLHLRQRNNYGLNSQDTGMAPKEDFDIPQDVMDRTFEQMERMRPFFTEPTSDREILIEIRDLLQNLELRLSPRPSLLILGDAVTTEWLKLTENKRG